MAGRGRGEARAVFCFPFPLVLNATGSSGRKQSLPSSRLLPVLCEEE